MTLLRLRGCVRCSGTLEKRYGWRTCINCGWEVAVTQTQPKPPDLSDPSPRPLTPVHVRVLEYVKEHPWRCAAEIAPVAGIGRGYASRALRELMYMGKVESREVRTGGPHSRARTWRAL